MEVLLARVSQFTASSLLQLEPTVTSGTQPSIVNGPWLAAGFPSLHQFPVRLNQSCSQTGKLGSWRYFSINCGLLCTAFSIAIPASCSPTSLLRFPPVHVRCSVLNHYLFGTIVGWVP